MSDLSRLPHQPPVRLDDLPHSPETGSKQDALDRVRHLALGRTEALALAERLLIDRNNAMAVARTYGATYAELSAAAGVNRSVAHYAVKGATRE